MIKNTFFMKIDRGLEKIIRLHKSNTSIVTYIIKILIIWVTTLYTLLVIDKCIETKELSIVYFSPNNLHITTGSVMINIYILAVDK